MNNAKKLSMADIKSLIKTTEKRDMDNPLFKMYKERWPGDENLVKIANALKRGSDYVVFANGDRFNVKRINSETVLIKPDFPKFAPMGFFSRDSLRKAEIEVGE